MSKKLDHVYTGANKFLNERMFLSVQPVKTEPCKLCYRLQYYLRFENENGFAGPV